MNKNLSLFMGLAMLGAAFCAHAADTSSTITSRKAPDLGGMAPIVGYVEAVSLVSGSQSFTFDIPAPRGSSNILGVNFTTTDVSGTAKPLTVSRSGATVTVTGSNATSGTLAVGDTVRAVVVYQR
ncbi:hypothetical protein [Mesorhizobium sp. B2-3-10]|uniref:hypothetical protein n=1 Tax=Mesorhizobium sp. B2-3-10 TaxID=2589954 RepID=UPI001125DFAB|nr:hypothetical protein [Mesorhizobium sp. B2-3-10]TPL98318.1 hypothetical protein FJ943_15550 [Mesorhizobium sp. B2-3-10]